MDNIRLRCSIALRSMSLVLALAHIISCSSGAPPRSHPALLISEIPISDNSSKIIIKSSLRLYPASVFSLMTMCRCTRLTMDRGFRYFHIDEKSRGTQADGQPGFRITFFKSPMEGMKVYPVEGMSVFSQEADDPLDGFDPEAMVVDAEGFEPACRLFYQHLKQAN